MMPRPGLTVEDRHAASPPSSRQAPSRSGTLSTAGRLSRRLRIKKSAHILVEIPTRDGDPRSDLGHASPWPGTYSDDYVKQVTTGTQTGGIVAQRWIAPLHGRTSNPRTIVAFPGPPPSPLTPVARSGCPRGLTKMACREQFDVSAMAFSPGY